MVLSTVKPLAGMWKPTQVQGLIYGPGSVKQNLINSLPSEISKVFIITGNSLANRTPLIKQVEQLLGDRHAGTFSQIKEHSPVHQLDEIVRIIEEQESVDTVLSVGGGSPIDSSKLVSHRFSQKTGRHLYHIAIPTTLSAAECTGGAGMKEDDGLKRTVMNAKLAPNMVIYDATFALETPGNLFLSTGLRALDHAIELMYHPTATEMPCRHLALQAASSLFIYLPKYKEDTRDLDNITQLQLAAFASLGFLGLNSNSPLGLSHTLGYALGSPYGIPHGVTSTLTLGHVVRLKAEEPKAAQQLSRMLPFLGENKSGDDETDARRVGERILQLVTDLGLETNLRSYHVNEDQAPIIAERATKLTSGPVYDRVLSLVKTLY